MYPSRFTSAPRDANCSTALESMNATSGAVPPATCVVSFVVALSADTAWNSIVMFGCKAWKSLANCFICGESPTQDEKVSFTGLVGSAGVIGDTETPGAALEFSFRPPTHAVATIATATSATPSLPDRHGSARL